jgi:hypothetical protein
MDDSKEHNLVLKALVDGLGNCVEWDDECADRVRRDDTLQGLTPDFIKFALISFVRNRGGAVVKQKVEDRPNWIDRYKYWYKVNVPIEGFRRPLFVELRLTDSDDPEFPEVTLVNAHW